MCVLHSQELRNHLEILSSNALAHFVVTLFQTYPEEDFNDMYLVSRLMMPFEIFVRYHKSFKQ